MNISTIKNQWIITTNQLPPNTDVRSEWFDSGIPCVKFGLVVERSDYRGDFVRIRVNLALDPKHSDVQTGGTMSIGKRTCAFEYKRASLYFCAAPEIFKNDKLILDYDLTFKYEESLPSKPPVSLGNNLWLDNEMDFKFIVEDQEIKVCLVCICLFLVSLSIVGSQVRA